MLERVNQCVWLQQILFVMIVTMKDEMFVTMVLFRFGALILDKIIGNK